MARSFTLCTTSPTTKFGATKFTSRDFQQYPHSSPPSCSVTSCNEQQTGDYLNTIPQNQTTTHFPPGCGKLLLPDSELNRAFAPVRNGFQLGPITRFSTCRWMVIRRKNKKNASWRPTASRRL